jgi:hypothetical protein
VQVEAPQPTSRNAKGSQGAFAQNRATVRYLRGDGAVGPLVVDDRRRPAVDLLEDATGGARPGARVQRVVVMMGRRRRRQASGTSSRLVSAQPESLRFGPSANRTGAPGPRGFVPIASGFGAKAIRPAFPRTSGSAGIAGFARQHSESAPWDRLTFDIWLKGARSPPLRASGPLGCVLPSPSRARPPPAVLGPVRLQCALGLGEPLPARHVTAPPSLRRDCDGAGWIAPVPNGAFGRPSVKRPPFQARAASLDLRPAPRSAAATRTCGTVRERSDTVAARARHRFVPESMRFPRPRGPSLDTRTDLCALSEDRQPVPWARHLGGCRPSFTLRILPLRASSHRCQPGLPPSRPTPTALQDSGPGSAMLPEQKARNLLRVPHGTNI